MAAKAAKTVCCNALNDLTWLAVLLLSIGDRRALDEIGFDTTVTLRPESAARTVGPKAPIGAYLCHVRV